MTRTLLPLVALFSSLVFVQASNDWSVPCFNGQCTYDMPSSGDAEAVGSMKIWGSPGAISDITPAAGWVILDCDKDALKQEIRVVCKHEDYGGCRHLDWNSGAVGKVVRLPESCGKSAFARISRSWVHKNQTIPASMESKITRRQNGVAPSVRGLALDTNFAAVDVRKTGVIRIEVAGATIPGHNGNLTITSPRTPTRRSRLNERHERRGLLDFILRSFDKFNKLDKDEVKHLPPVNVDVTLPIFEESVSCPPLSASIKGSAKAKANALITIASAASGTLIPPKLDGVGVFANINGNVEGSLSLTGSASGEIDSGEVTLFRTGIPGLDFPGILTVGPVFKVLARGNAKLDIDVNLDMGFNYELKDVKMFFPPSSAHPSGGKAQTSSSPLTLSVGPSISSRGVVKASIIPQLDVGVEGLGGLASAKIFLNLDASAQMNLSLDGNAGITKGRRSDEESEANIEKRQVSTTVGIKGCVDVGAALSINAGADASFFGLFNPSHKTSLLTKQFEIFKKCFSAGSPKREIDDSALAPPSLVLEKRGLQCLRNTNQKTLVSLIQQSLKPKEK